MNTTDNQEELLIVVDEKNKPIDCLPRKKVHQKNLLHRTISILVFNDKGQLWLQKRSLTKDNYPGFYGMAAGGHVLKGQSYEEAAKKEAKEELDVELDLEYISTIRIKDSLHQTFTAIYKSIHNGPFKINPEETESINHYSLDQLPQLSNQIPSPTKQILKVAGILK